MLSSCSLVCSGGTRISKTIFRWINTLSRLCRNSAAGVGKAAKAQLCSPREGPAGDETWTSLLVWKKPGVRISSWPRAGWSGAGVWAEPEMVPLGSDKKTPRPPSSSCYEVWIWTSRPFPTPTLLCWGWEWPCCFPAPSPTSGAPQKAEERLSAPAEVLRYTKALQTSLLCLNLQRSQGWKLLAEK